ncbi:MAG: cadherin-like domain-containing protein [Flavobacteriaceae bacterium]|nr:cadherin-like domain-containing protein [Flavobacteriaceae bacterium]
MKRICLRFFGFLTLAVLFFACNKDDGGDTYVPLNITTQPDAAEVFQNATVDIPIFSNDSNVPTDGVLQLSNPSSGSATVLDNGTPSNTQDDSIRYTPSDSFFGEVTFQYTICDANSENCETETVTITVLPISPVVFDIDAVPYPKLSDYNFFNGNMADHNPVYGVLPYKPTSSLFTDYALKKRFVWMPMGTQASYVSDSELLDFPVGAILIKTFYYENVQPGNNTQIIETRLLIKKSDGWITADYLWNDAQNEADLDTSGDGGFVDITWLQDGVEKSTNYRIPADSQCFTCHKANFVNAPIGTKPQSLDSDYPYADGAQNQLQKWMDMGYLANNVPDNINGVVDYNDTSQPLDLRVRSYFDINCASCHSDEGHCNYRAIRFAFDETTDPVLMGVCDTPQTPIPGYDNSKIITPGAPDDSVLFFRMETNEENYRMPLLGRTIQHEEGVALIEEWINSLSENCN